MRCLVLAQTLTCALCLTGCFVFPDGDEPPDSNGDTNNGGANNGGNPDPMGDPVITGPPNFMLECGQPTPYDSADVLDGWRSEAEGIPDRGREATFDLRGTPFQVAGSSRIDLSGALQFSSPATTTPDQQFLFFPNAVTSEGTGLLILEMESAEAIDGAPSFVLEASAAQLTEASTAEVSTNPGFSALLAGEYPGQFPATVPDDWNGARDAWMLSLSSDATVGAIEIPSYRRGILIVADGEPVRLRPDESISIEEAAGLVVANDTRVEQEGEISVEGTFAQFGVAGEFTEGVVEADGFPDRLPNALFGRDAVVAIDGGGVSSTDARITQAVNSGGLVYPAHVEIAPNRDFEIEVPHGEKRRVAFHFRETTFLADAALAEVVVEPEAAGEMVELSIASGLLIDELVQWVVDAGYAWPIAAIGATIIAPFVVIADVVGCLLGRCPEAPTPFPSWMDAGAVGSFDVEFDGGVEPGVYDLTLKFIGQNFCDVPVSVTVVVL